MVQTETAIAGELSLQGSERGVDKGVKYGLPVGGRVETHPSKSACIAWKAANLLPGVILTSYHVSHFYPNQKRKNVKSQCEGCRRSSTVGELEMSFCLD